MTLSAAPTLVFNPVFLPDSSSNSLSISNTGSTPALLSGTPAVSGPFKLDTNGCNYSVSPSGTCSLALSYHPTISGSQTGSVVVNYAKTDGTSAHSLTFALNGSAKTVGTVTASTTTAAFSRTAFQLSRNLAITLTNPGGNAVTGLSVSGTQSGLSLNLGSCSSIPANGSCNVNVAFSPLTSGPVSAQLVLHYQDGRSPQSLSFAATGVGQATLILTSDALAGGASVNAFFGSSSAVLSIPNNPAGSLASCDLYGDGNQEIVTGAAPGQPSWVNIYDLSGNLKNSFQAYPGFMGGVNVACGDINQDGKAEIITGTGDGGGPQVMAFDANGKNLLSFFAYPSTLRCGVRVAAGDLYGTGREQIITAPGPGGGPQIQAFDSNGTSLLSFFAYDSAFRGGVFVAAGDVMGEGKAKIITAPGPTGGPQIQGFDSNGTSVFGFLAYDASFTGGVRVAAGDINADGKAEILTLPASGGGPEIAAFTPSGNRVLSFWAFGQNLTAGFPLGFTK